MYFYGSYPTWNQYPYSFAPYPVCYGGLAPYMPTVPAVPFYHVPGMSTENIIHQNVSQLSIEKNQQKPQIRSQNNEAPCLDTPQPIQKKENRKSQSFILPFRQKEGRNIFSNIFRQFLRYFFYNKERSLQLIGSISKKRHFEMSPKQFYNVLLKKTNNLKTYVRVDQIQSFIERKKVDDKVDEFNEIFRILLMIHLKNNHTSAVFYSGKVPKNARKMHYIYGRKMQSMLQG